MWMELYTGGCYSHRYLWCVILPSLVYCKIGLFIYFRDNDKPVISQRKPAAPQGLFETVTALPCKLVTNVVIGTVGRRLVYPGSTGLLGSAVCKYECHCVKQPYFLQTDSQRNKWLFEKKFDYLSQAKRKNSLTSEIFVSHPRITSSALVGVVVDLVGAGWVTWSTPCRRIMWLNRVSLIGYVIAYGARVASLILRFALLTWKHWLNLKFSKTRNLLLQLH